jgi:purine-cytosine permease-like protein
VLPIKVLILGLVILIFFTSDKPEFAFGNVTSGGSWSWSIMAVWVSVTVATHLTMYTDAADLSRYARSPRHGALAFYLAALTSTLFCGVIGATAAKAVGDQNWFQAAAEVQPHAWMYFMLLVVLIADNWFINVMNLYTGGFAIVNVISRIGRFWATIACAVVGVVLSGFTGVYENTPVIVTEIGYAFAPVGGILLAHFILLSRWRLDLVGLYQGGSGRYRYLHGINPVAVVVGVLGYIAARSQIIPTVWLTELSIAVLTGLAYACVMKVVARWWQPARDSFDHAAMLDVYDELDLDEQLLRH